MRFSTLTLFRIEPDEASLAEAMPTLPLPGGPVRLNRRGSLPPPSSRPQPSRRATPSISRPPRSGRGAQRAGKSGSSNQGHLRYLRLLPRRDQVADRPRGLPHREVEPEPAPPPSPQELSGMLSDPPARVAAPASAVPRSTEPPTAEPELHEAWVEPGEAVRRRGMLPWLAAGSVSLALVLGLLSLLGATLQPAPPRARRAPPRPAVEPRIVITPPPASPTAAAPRPHPAVSQPRRTAPRRTASRGSARRHRFRRRSRPTVDPDRLLSAARRRPAVNPDVLLAAGSRRRDRRGIVLPSWSR